jgi:elongation factor 2 kinase
MEEYGEANLGSKGMALFFSSHLCSPLCFALGLTQFDLNDKELEKINSQCWETQPSTMVSPSEEKMMSLAAGAKRKESLTEVFERVTLTLGPLISPAVSGAQNSICSEGSPLNTPDDQTFSFENVFKKEMADKSSPLAMSGRDRTTSTDSDTVTRSMESIKRKNMDRSASVSKQIGLGGDLRHIKNKLRNLGEVHYEMAVYHSIGRFTTEPDLESSLFHLHKSGECNFTRALHELGCIYLQLPHYQLEHLSVEVRDGESNHECTHISHRLL